MALVISSIQTPDGYTYKLKDEEARESIENIVKDIKTEIGTVSSSNNGLMTSTMYTDSVAPLSTAIWQYEIDAIFGDIIEEQGSQTVTDP